MYDLIITNGSVASAHDVLPLDVAVKDEKIVALGVRGQFDQVGATRVLDATGKYVVPGGIDPHVHFDLAMSETMVAQGPGPGSRAALHGGTTTYIDFSYSADHFDLVKSVQDKIDTTLAQRPHADFALHAMMTGDFPLSTAEQIREVISGGVLSVNLFTQLDPLPT